MNRSGKLNHVWLPALLLVASCQQNGDQTMSGSDSGPDIGGPVTELIVDDVVLGDGDEATAGANVQVHYTGWLYAPEIENRRGDKFDSSLDRGDPFVFPLGAGRVIRGWDEGVAGMRVGGKRILIIPADMAYGDRGAGAVIPPGATLVFEVELLGVD